MERTIEISGHLPVAAERSAAVLREDPWSILTERATAHDRLTKRYRMPIEVTVASDAALEHDVEVEVGGITSTARETQVRLTWAPTEHVRLLPSFDGSLVIRPGSAGGTDVVLAGTYRVPLGPIGRFGDSVAGQRVARQSLTGVVERFTGRLSHELRRRADATPFRPAAGVPDLRDAQLSDQQPSDNYLG
jgi:hypothetical protein